MKALILNSGMGNRMGVLTAEQPKCMTEISSKETIISRQLHQLVYAGIEDVVITTGEFDDVLVKYVQGLDLPLNISFVHNDKYENTNYIYSIFKAKEYLQNTDILLMHGDIVFENGVIDELMPPKNEHEPSVITISSTCELPQKDFKAVIRDGKVKKLVWNFLRQQ